ncbi:MAG: PLDc N-terminal domain-containing protein [Candidatus Wallacebacter cryptica]
MDVLKEYWPFLVPLIIAEVVLMIAALTHVLKHRNYRFGTRAFWIPIVLFIQIIGPIVYFVFGRGEE